MFAGITMVVLGLVSYFFGVFVLTLLARKLYEDYKQKKRERLSR